MVTEKQLDNVYNLPLEDIRLVLDVCIEALGVVDIQDAQKILHINRSRVYQKMNDNNSIRIGKHKYPCINLLIKH